VTLAERKPAPEVLTVRQVNEGIATAIARSFPATIWVRGEVQRFPHDAARRTHLYFELHESGASGAAEYQIAVSLMGWDRQRYDLGRYVDGSDPDFQIANQMEVCLEVKVDFYAKFGKMSLKVVGVDKNFALGRLEAQRRQTLAYLKLEKLLEKNASITFPDLPLHIGLITSPGSAAEQDFRTGLSTSGWPFRVHLEAARMQGAQLQAEVIRALGRQVKSGVQVIVITRGGGSRADLSWFDQRDLAVAIARCPLPVVTAIGHDIDHSIADEVAHSSCKTPTAAAEFLVDRVEVMAHRLETVADELIECLDALFAESHGRIDLAERLGRATEGALLRARVRYQEVAARLQRVVSRDLAVRAGHLGDLRVRLSSATATFFAAKLALLGNLSRKTATGAEVCLVATHSGLAQQEARLRREALRPLAPWSKKMEHYEVQCRLLDPRRLLQRGYTITRGPAGQAVCAAGSLAPGDRLITLFVDGEVLSVVQPGGKAGLNSDRKVEKSGGKKDQTNSGQKTLFR